jgi:hypothetical protein
MRLLVRAAKSIRAAGLKPDPSTAKEAAESAGKPVERDWEGIGRDLGRAVRKFRDGGRSGG